MKPLRTRVEALEFGTGTGRDARELSDEQLDAKQLSVYPACACTDPCRGTEFGAHGG
jgi:hypothetical protein